MPSGLCYWILHSQYLSQLDNLIIYFLPSPSFTFNTRVIQLTSLRNLTAGLDSDQDTCLQKNNTESKFNFKVPLQLFFPSMFFCCIIIYLAYSSIFQISYMILKHFIYRGILIQCSKSPSVLDFTCPICPENLFFRITQATDNQE